MSCHVSNTHLDLPKESAHSCLCLCVSCHRRLLKALPEELHENTYERANSMLPVQAFITTWSVTAVCNNMQRSRKSSELDQLDILHKSIHLMVWRKSIWWWEKQKAELIYRLYKTSQSIISSKTEIAEFQCELIKNLVSLCIMFTWWVWSVVLLYLKLSQWSIGNNVIYFDNTTLKHCAILPQIISACRIVFTFVSNYFNH